LINSSDLNSFAIFKDMEVFGSQIKHIGKALSIARMIPAAVRDPYLDRIIRCMLNRHRHQNFSGIHRKVRYGWRLGISDG